MTVCVVNGCHNSTDKNNKASNITFHMFPSDPVVSDRWTRKIRLNRNESYWKPSKSTKICSIHFDDKDKYITKGGLCRIRRGAVPTKDIPVFSTCLDDEKLLDSNESNQHQVNSTDGDAESEALVIDSSPTIFDTPKKASLQRQLNNNITHLKRENRIIKTLKQKYNRLIKKKYTLNKILLTLQKERLIDNDISNILSQNLFAAELYDCLVKKRIDDKFPMPKYTPEFKKFCLTLHSYSPEAYMYVRKTFDTVLPHPDHL